MRVSTIFADVLEKNPDESKDVIRKRFKTNDELRSFKSCDNYGENVTEDKLQETRRDIQGSDSLSCTKRRVILLM